MPTVSFERPLFGGARWQSRATWLLAGIWLYLVAFIALLLGKSGTHATIDAAGRLLSALGPLPLTAGACVLCWHVSRHIDLPESTRRAWRLIAAAHLADLVAGVTAFVLQVTQGVTAPDTIAALPSLAYYPLLAAGLFAFPTTLKSDRTRFLLDGTTVIVSGAIVVWYFVLGPLAQGAALNPLAKLVLVLCPIFDLVAIVGIAYLALRQPQLESRQAVVVLITSLIPMIAGDLVFTARQVVPALDNGLWDDGLWAISSAGVALAAHLQIYPTERTSKSEGADPSTHPYSLLPYLGVLIGYGLLLYASRRTWDAGLDPLMLAAMLLTGLVVARQLLALRENAWLLGDRMAREARFRSLVQNSSDVVTVIDAKGVIRYQSASIERVCGYRPDYLQNRPYKERVHPDDRQAVQRFLGDTAFNDGGSAPVEWRMRHRSGTWLYMEHVATNLLHDRSVRGIVINSRDVSERRGLQDQLLQAQKMEAVGRLAAGVAHDFNNLLTAIGANADLAMADLPETAPARKDLEEIHRATNRAAALTKQLLAFGRKGGHQATVVDVNDVIGAMELMVRRLAKPGTEFAWRPADKSTSVRIDAGQLEQVVMNLVVNACDAMPGGGRLTIETDRNQLDRPAVRGHLGIAPGEYVIIRVIDTGVGMDEETQAHLFEPFFTTKPPGRGTGLGLSTAYAIVTGVRGHIAVRSALNQGTTMTVYLPASVGDTSLVRPADEPSTLRRGSETILIVDDEEGIRIAARRMLLKQGYTVLAAHNGLDALRTARGHHGPIHLLLTDLVMPEMGGLDLVERFRHDRPATRVICMSGYSDDDEVARKLENIHGSFLPKPFTMTELSHALRRVLDDAPTASKAASLL